MTRLIIALMLAVLWGGFSTYKWIGASAVQPVKCDNTKLVQENERLKKQLEKAGEQTDKGNQARTEVREVFVPVKEVVYADRVVTNCTGDFPARLREAVNRAVDTANGKELPATGNGTR